MTSKKTLELMKNLLRAWHPMIIEERFKGKELNLPVHKCAYADTLAMCDKLKTTLTPTDLRDWNHWSTH